ncbi:MAG: hypothetical protein ABEJ71_01955 [Halodesulfurarchaeum sp.]
MPDDPLGGWLKRAARKAGRGVERLRSEFAEGRVSGSLPRDEEGRARLVCRRYAERRAVHLENGRPECFEAGHPDCESCAQDTREGVVETW